MAGQCVKAPAAILQEDILVTASAGGREEFITGFIVEAGGVDLVALGRTQPALVGEYRGNRFGGQQILLVKGLGFAPFIEGRTALITVLFSGCLKLFLNQGFQSRIGTQQQFQLGFLLGQLFLLGADFHLFQSCQLAQLGIQDIFRLGVGETKAGDKCRLGFIFGADNMNHFIDIQKRN